MKFKLNRWQVVGIVLSVIWIIGAGWYAHHDDVERANNFVEFADKVCADSIKLQTSTPEKCKKQHDENVATWMEGDTGNVLFIALAPLPVFWLIGFVLLYAGRAQIVGFRAVVPWRTMSWRGKLYTVGCVVFVVGASLFGLLVLLNEDVDAQVPISPSPRSFVSVQNGNNVTVVGTWTRTDLTNDTIANPIQSSEIHCWRLDGENHCMEARGEIAGSSLMISSWEHSVKSWTQSAIVMEDDDLCAREIYTIDLNTEVVSGVGYRINEDQAYCQTSWQEDSPKRWTMLLEDGFKVFWEERQKRRPWLLRVMQSILGN